jgi:hypothetical protein
MCKVNRYSARLPPKKAYLVRETVETAEKPTQQVCFAFEYSHREWLNANPSSSFLLEGEEQPIAWLTEIQTQRYTSGIFHQGSVTAIIGSPLESALCWFLQEFVKEICWAFWWFRKKNTKLILREIRY